MNISKTFRIFYLNEMFFNLDASYQGNLIVSFHVQIEIQFVYFSNIKTLHLLINPFLRIQNVFFFFNFSKYSIPKKYSCKNILHFSSYEKVLVLCEKWLSKFSSYLYVLRPPESEKTVFTKVSVCLSVCL